MTFKSLLIAPLCLTLCGCSMTRFFTPVPRLQENLSAACPDLSPRPEPLLDPERLTWEIETVTAYADCAKRHRLTVEAWPKAAASK